MEAENWMRTPPSLLTCARSALWAAVSIIWYNFQVIHLLTGEGRKREKCKTRGGEVDRGTPAFLSGGISPFRIGLVTFSHTIQHTYSWPFHTHYTIQHTATFIDFPAVCFHRSHDIAVIAATHIAGTTIIQTIFKLKSWNLDSKSRQQDCKFSGVE